MRARIYYLLQFSDSLVINQSKSHFQPGNFRIIFDSSPFRKPVSGPLVVEIRTDNQFRILTLLYFHRKMQGHLLFSCLI